MRVSYRRKNNPHLVTFFQTLSNDTCPLSPNALLCQKILRDNGFISPTSDVTVTYYDWMNGWTNIKYTTNGITRSNRRGVVSRESNIQSLRHPQLQECWPVIYDGSYNNESWGLFKLKVIKEMQPCQIKREFLK